MWPNLAKMVKQFFAQSAGVERVFSAAGKMHDDLRKSAKDSSLEHSLFAAYNTRLGRAAAWSFGRCTRLLGCTGLVGVQGWRLQVAH